MIGFESKGLESGPLSKRFFIYCMAYLRYDSLAEVAGGGQRVVDLEGQLVLGQAHPVPDGPQLIGQLSQRLVRNLLFNLVLLLYLCRHSLRLLLFQPSNDKAPNLPPIGAVLHLLHIPDQFPVDRFCWFALDDFLLCCRRKRV